MIRYWLLILQKKIATGRRFRFDRGVQGPVEAGEWQCIKPGENKNGDVGAKNNGQARLVSTGEESCFRVQQLTSIKSFCQ